MQKLISLIKQRRVWIPLVAVFLVILGVIFTTGKEDTKRIVTVEQGTVVSEINLTGSIKPAQSINLAFERSGRLQQVRVSVGQTAQEGQTLLELENADVRSQVLQAQAQYESQDARLKELEKGASLETLALYEAAVANAYKGATDVLFDAYARSEDAVRTQTAELFTYDEEQSVKMSFSSTEVDSQILASQYRYQAGKYLDELRKEIQTVQASDQKKIDALLEETRTRIRYFLELFSYIEKALNSSNALTDQTKALYKTYAGAGRSQLNVALSGINTREQLITTALKELALKKSGSTQEALAYQRAQVAQALASVQYAQSQLAKTIIRAPFTGIVTKIPKNKGDIIQAQETAVGIIGVGTYQIEARVTESDVAKIKIGDIGRVTLDAYTDDVVFEARVVGIDLSETITDGVSTYKTTLELLQEDSRIISGMTADIDIISQKKEDVLFIPSRNIITENGKRFVQKIVDEKKGTTETIEVVTGLRGSDGRTEIVSGITQGEKILAE